MRGERQNFLKFQLKKELKHFLIESQKLSLKNFKKKSLNIKLIIQEVY